MDQIVLNHVTKQFTTKTLGTVTAVNDFNLTIKEGECFSFLGPSGCGKTTTLRMIAGFEDLSDGEIHLCGRPVSIKSKNLYVPPEERGLGMVFQSFAVWPHMNIFENVAFPLRVRKVPKAEMIERVKMALKHTSLDGMERSIRATSPADSSSASRWHAPSSPTRRSCFWMSRFPTSTRSCAKPCALRSRSCKRSSTSRSSS